MDRGTITLDLTGGNQDEGWLEPVAGGLLWCDQPLRPGGARAPRPPGAALPEDLVLTPVYDGPGLVDGGIQRIRSFVAKDGTRKVEFEDGESFLIAAAGDRIARVISDPPEALVDHTWERALGGPMALALAARGIFLLHASALAGHGGVVAICGESGAGKSTLAAAPPSFPELGLSRVADDQLPVSLGPNSYAMPHFPQLKLPPGEGYPPDASSVVPLAMVAELFRAPGPGDGLAASALQLERLGAAEACLALARATVAARLFDPRLLGLHLQACAAASATVEVCRLRYPSGLDRLRDPLAALAERVAQLPPRD